MERREMQKETPLRKKHNKYVKQVQEIKHAELCQYRMEQNGIEKI